METSTYSNSSDSSEERERRKRKQKRKYRNALDKSCEDNTQPRKLRLSDTRVKVEANENSKNNSILPFSIQFSPSSATDISDLISDSSEERERPKRKKKRKHRDVYRNALDKSCEDNTRSRKQRLSDARVKVEANGNSENNSILPFSIQLSPSSSTDISDLSSDSSEERESQKRKKKRKHRNVYRNALGKSCEDNTRSGKLMLSDARVKEEANGNSENNSDRSIEDNIRSRNPRLSNVQVKAEANGNSENNRILPSATDRSEQEEKERQKGKKQRKHRNICDKSFEDNIRSRNPRLSNVQVKAEANGNSENNIILLSASDRSEEERKRQRRKKQRKHRNISDKSFEDNIPSRNPRLSNVYVNTEANENSENNIIFLSASDRSEEETERQRRKKQRKNRNISDISFEDNIQSRNPRLSNVHVNTEANENNRILPSATDNPPFNSKESTNRTNGTNTTETALLHQLLRSIEEIRAKVVLVEQKVDLILNQTSSALPYIPSLPPDLNLPLSTEQELEIFNDRIKRDLSLSTILFNHFYHAASGRTITSFITSILKKILTANLASQYSRFGRKGKKSFEAYRETLNVIIAASQKKFVNMERDDLLEAFGRSLACSPDWCGRKKRRSFLTTE